MSPSSLGLDEAAQLFGRVVSDDSRDVDKLRRALGPLIAQDEFLMSAELMKMLLHGIRRASKCPNRDTELTTYLLFSFCRLVAGVKANKSIFKSIKDGLKTVMKLTLEHTEVQHVLLCQAIKTMTGNPLTPEDVEAVLLEVLELPSHNLPTLTKHMPRLAQDSVDVQGLRMSFKFIEDKSHVSMKSQPSFRNHETCQTKAWCIDNELLCPEATKMSTAALCVQEDRLYGIMCLGKKTSLVEIPGWNMSNAFIRTPEDTPSQPRKGRLGKREPIELIIEMRGSIYFNGSEVLVPSVTIHFINEKEAKKALEMITTLGKRQFERQARQLSTSVHGHSPAPVSREASSDNAIRPRSERLKRKRACLFDRKDQLQGPASKRMRQEEDVEMIDVDQEVQQAAQPRPTARHARTLRRKPMYSSASSTARTSSSRLKQRSPSPPPSPSSPARVAEWSKITSYIDGIRAALLNICTPYFSVFVQEHENYYKLLEYRLSLECES